MYKIINSYFFVSVFLLICISTSHGQEKDTVANKRNSIGIQSGYYRAGLLDKTLSPLLFIGNGMDYSLNYQRQSNKSINRIEIEFTKLAFYPEDKSIDNKFNYVSHNKTEVYKSYPWNSINVTLRYEYLRNLNIKNSKIKVYLGGISNNFIQIIYPGTWLIAYSLGPKGTMQYSINKKNSINSSLEFPVFSLVERPVYAVWNNDIIYNPIFERFYSGKIMFPNNYFYCRLFVEYNYIIAKRWNILASYRFNWIKCKRTRDYTSIINTLNLGINYKF